MQGHRKNAMVMRQDNNPTDVVQPWVDARAFELVKAAYSVNETLELLSIGRTTFL